MKKLNLWIVFIIVLAFGLRCIRMESRSIQYDDAFSILLSQQSFAGIVQGTAADTMPPLYYFLLHTWMLLGEGIWFYRILSVFLSLGCLLGGYFAIAELLDVPAALWGAFLIAISPIHIYHAQDLRMYTLLVLGEIWYFVCFLVILKALEEKRPVSPWLWLGFIVSGTIAFYSHNLAVFFLIAPNVYLILRKKWMYLAKFCFAQLGIGILSLPWLFFIPGQIDKIQHAFWTPRPGLIELFQAVLMFTVSLPLSGILLAVGAVLSIQYFVIILFETIRVWKTHPAIRTGLFFLFFTPAILFFVSYLIRPVFVPRGFLISSIFYLGLAGWIISRRKQRGIGVFIAGGFILAAVISLPSFYTYEQFPRSPFQAATEYLEEQANVRTVEVIHDNKLSFFPMKYLSDNLSQTFLADAAGSHNDTLAPGSQKAMNLFPVVDIQTATEGKDSIDFVVFRETIDEYIDLGEVDHPTLTWLKENYRLSGVKVFNDLEIYHFYR